jgi:hypothetical protein
MGIGARGGIVPFATLAAFNKSCYKWFPIKLVPCRVVHMTMMIMQLHNFMSPSEMVATSAKSFLAQSVKDDDDAAHELSKSSNYKTRIDHWDIMSPSMFRCLSLLLWMISNVNIMDVVQYLCDEF